VTRFVVVPRVSGDKVSRVSANSWVIQLNSFTHIPLMRLHLVCKIMLFFVCIVRHPNAAMHSREARNGFLSILDARNKAIRFSSISI